VECDEIRKWFEAYLDDKRHREWIELEEWVGERIRKKGRCSRLMVLPKEVREALDLKDGDQVVFVEDDKRIYIVKGPIEVKV